MDALIGGAWRLVKSAEAYLGGGFKRIVRSEVYTGGAWKAGDTFLVPLTATASPSTVYGYYEPELRPVRIYTGETTVTPAGGLGPFTYSWANISGTGTVTRPGLATTDFYRSPGTGTAVFRCTVTDALGATATTDVTADFS